jgi:cytochrome c553
VLLALTGYEWGLFSSAVVFIVFALVVALVVPRSRPTFPSSYLGWFIAGCIVLFAAQMTSVVLLAEVGEAHETAAEEPAPTETEPTETTPTETTETTPTETTETTETTDTTEPPTETEPTETTETETPPPASGNAEAGREVFETAACGGCHTLADAGTDGVIGPNLDASMPPVDLVVERVTNGSGVMPSFKDQLTPQQIQDVAAYVSSVAGG